MSATPSSPRRLLALLLGALALLLILGWLARGWLAERDARLDLFAAPPCDLGQGPCEARRGDDWLRLGIEGPLDAHRPLPLRVEISKPADQVAVDFQGVEMFMGHNHFVLQPQADGSYRGEGRLPVCTTGTMRWRARVLITRGGTTHGSWFDFNAG